jgi:XTP/dITP diphosphohydrolase
MLIVFATNNNHKLTEISKLMGNNFHLLSLADINLDEDIPEDEPTLEANALHKARYIFLKTGHNVFADDTGLEVDALGGRPGVHSAGSPGKIRTLMQILINFCRFFKPHKPKARFRTIIALIYEGMNTCLKCCQCVDNHR